MNPRRFAALLFALFLAGCAKDAVVTVVKPHMAPGLAAPEWNDRDVKAYSLWDVAASYRFKPALRLRAGILNVADTAPPFTNQSRYFQVTWDPTYGDPRGRSFYVNAQYKF